MRRFARLATPLPFASAKCPVRGFNISIGGDDDADAPKLQPQSAPAADAVQRARPTLDELAAVEDNTGEVLLAERNLQQQEDDAIYDNARLQPPLHPDSLAPVFHRIKRSAKLVRIDEDDRTVVRQKESFMRLRPPAAHPWVEDCPIGPSILHGDGQLGVHGTGEVGFEETASWRELPKSWRGLNHLPTVGMAPSQKMGYVSQDTVVKHSLRLTGRGLFASSDIKEGDLIMVVRSSATSLGFNSLIDRLLRMTRDMILAAHAGSAEDRDYLHQWILTGQQSSRIEHWAAEHTDRVIEMIGGRPVLDDLELHPLHVARLAAVIDMNHFVIEGFYNEDKGKGYWPEAGLMNHSCVPNADYDIMPVDEFIVSDYNPSSDSKAAMHDAKKAAEKRAGEAYHAAHREAAAAEAGEHSCGDPGCAHEHHAAPAAAAAKLPDVSNLLRSFASGDRGRVDADIKEYSDWAFGAGAPSVEKTIPGRREPKLELSKAPAVKAAGATTVTETIETPHLSSSTEAGGDAAPQSQEIMRGDGEMVTIEQKDESDDHANVAVPLTYARNEYVFCCKANQDIPLGTEVTIAYIPPEWRHDYRQQVLRDRYRFWCRCPKCAPAMDAKFKTWPRVMMAIIIVYFILQIGVYQARADTLTHMEESEKGILFSNERRHST
jgi:hypothetical protein